MSIDTTVALHDLEVTFHTPLAAPRVRAEPVAQTVLNTPADNFDGVTTSDTAGNVVVDTRLVTEEVLIDSESSLKRSVIEELVLDFINLCGVDNRANLASILLPGLGGAKTFRDAYARFFGCA